MIYCATQHLQFFWDTSAATVHLLQFLTKKNKSSYYWQVLGWETLLCVCLSNRYVIA